MRKQFVLWIWLYSLSFVHCKGNDRASSEPPPAPAESAPSEQDSPEVAEPRDAEPAPRTEPSVANSAGDPLLWVVHSKDGHHKSHLFGTMHIGVDAEEDIHPLVWSSLESSKEVVLEIISSELTFAQTQELLFLPEGKTLKSGLSATQWTTLKQNITGFPEAQLPRISPLMASVLLTSAWLPVKVPLDRVIENKAREKGLDVSGLESFEETMVFAQNPAHIAYLALMLDDIDGAKEELGRMHRAYLEGDAEAMQALVFSPENRESFPELYEQLFFRRNRAWVPKIEERIEKRSTFIAVGAGHLVGEGSVIELLEQRGFKIERVVPPT